MFCCCLSTRNLTKTFSPLQPPFFTTTHNSSPRHLKKDVFLKKQFCCFYQFFPDVQRFFNACCYYIIKINSRPIFFSRNPPHNQKKKKKCLRDCYARQGDASKLALFEALDPRNTLRPKLAKDSRMRRFILESFSHKGQSSSKSSSTLLCQFLCVTYKAVQV